MLARESSSLIEALAAAYRGHSYELQYLFTDESLLDPVPVLLSPRIGDKIDKENPNYKVALEIAEMLRDRRLFVRAVAFGIHLPELENDSPPRKGLNSLLIDLDGTKREVFIKSLAKEVQTVLVTAGRAETCAHLADKTLVSYLWVETPTKEEHAKKVNRAFLIKEGKKVYPYESYCQEVSRWSQGYLSRKDVGTAFEKIQFIFDVVPIGQDREKIWHR